MKAFFPISTYTALAITTSVLVGGCESLNVRDAPVSEAMIAAADPRAVHAGLAVLDEGGTAVDAAIAVQAVLGLVEPQSSGIAGGAFLIYQEAKTGDVTMYDGRETAPADVTPKLFIGEGHKKYSYVEGIASGKSTGVPGAIAMLHLAHEDHGKLNWSRGFEEAISYGQKGFVVSERLHQSLSFATRFKLLNQQKAARDYFFLEDGETPLPTGFVRDNQAYAQTLTAIAQNYRNLYEGPIAQAIIDGTRETPRPGTLSLSDMANYKPRKRPALCSPYKDVTICGAQPPSSGGVATQAIMRTLENIDMSQHGPNTALGWHYFIEASRLSYADRDLYVGDDKFVEVPIEEMLASDYLSRRAALISEDKAIDTVTAGDPVGFKRAADHTPDNPGTSHMSIVDSYGNALSMTTTVEAGFGSQRMAAGMILNNQLTDFSFQPLTPTGDPIANAVAAGKRPRSSMAPTLVLDEHGDFLFATGSPGGNSIIAYTAKTLLGVLEWGLSPQEAADLPNVIARGAKVKMERTGMSPQIIEELERKGHELTLSRGEQSGIHIILRHEDGELEGGADKRREGIAMSLTQYRDMKVVAP